MELQTLVDVFVDTLQDLSDSEDTVLALMEEAAAIATSDKLKRVLLTHIDETRIQRDRLDHIGRRTSLSVTGKSCDTIRALASDTRELLSRGGEPTVVDAALIASLQRIEHFELACYGTARALAECLGYKEAAGLLSESLKEESATDERLTQIAYEEVNQLAANSEFEPDYEDEEEEDETTEDFEPSFPLGEKPKPDFFKGNIGK